MKTPEEIAQALSDSWEGRKIYDVAPFIKDIAKAIREAEARGLEHAAQDLARAAAAWDARKYQVGFNVELADGECSLAEYVASVLKQMGENQFAEAAKLRGIAEDK